MWCYLILGSTKERPRSIKNFEIIGIGYGTPYPDDFSELEYNYPEYSSFLIIPFHDKSSIYWNPHEGKIKKGLIAR